MCLNPLKAILVNIEEDDGLISRRIFFHSRIDLFEGQDFEEIYVPCRKCFECLQKKTSDWVTRILNESTLHDDVCFLTLTFNNDNLPNVFNWRPLQLFLKRLRKSIQPKKIKYFACREYGSKGHRPHYHIIIFGWKPKPDLLLSKKEDIYRSFELEKLWPLGYSSVGYDISEKSVKYLVKYLNKDGKIVASQGLGFNAVDFEKSKFGALYIDGQVRSMPQYYKRKFLESGKIPNLTFNQSFIKPNHNEPEEILKRIKKYEHIACINKIKGV